MKRAKPPQRELDGCVSGREALGGLRRKDFAHIKGEAVRGLRRGLLNTKDSKQNRVKRLTIVPLLSRVCPFARLQITTVPSMKMG